MLLGIYKQLCLWNCSTAGSVKKKLSAEQRDHLLQMYAPLIEAAPSSPLVDKRPGGPLDVNAADCSNPEFKQLLTGRKRPEGPRFVVDIFTGMGGGPELDLLELRLHEMDGVADIVVVTESRFGNRCDRKLLHFDRQKQRFAAFLPRIVHVVTDRCPTYFGKAQRCHDKKKRPVAVYFQEEGQRNCTVSILQKDRPDIPDDALVVMTDLDEIPRGKTINLFKHCEVRSKARLPLRLQLQAIPFSLRSGCPKSRELYNKGSLSYWREFRESYAKGGKHVIGIWPKSHTDPVPRGGAHLTSVGSRGQLDYRMLNHGESGQIQPLVDYGGGMLKVCQITTAEQLTSLQKQISESPLSVMRHHQRPDPKKRVPRADAKAAEHCDVPWPLRTSRARYPFIWGDVEPSEKREGL